MRPSPSPGPDAKIVAVLALGFASLGVLLSSCSAPQAGIARGEELYDTCRNCHADDGLGKEEVAAPPIAGLPAWYIEQQINNFRMGLRGAHPSDEAGQRMRPMVLSLQVEDKKTGRWSGRDDVKAVAAYVSTMPNSTPARALAATEANRGKQPIGDATAGKATYATCTACHQGNGAGNKALKAPPIAGQPTWYLLSSLDKYKRGLRGAHPKDATGAQMRAIALTLPDKAAMRDVVAYIATLPPLPPTKPAPAPSAAGGR